MYLTGQPGFLFEAQIMPSEDKKAFSIRPAIATYFAPIDTRFLRPSKDRNIALFFSFTPPGTKPTLESNPSATVLVGAMQSWTTRKYAVDGSSPSVYESPWFTLSREDASNALTLSVLMTETQGEQAFLKFIGSVLTEPTVVAAANADLANRLIPAEREASRNTDQNNYIAAVNKRDDAYLQYREKITACANAQDADARRKAAKEAKEAMAGYIKADQEAKPAKGEISPGLVDSIHVDGDSSALQSKCKSLANGLSK
ncbi:hypothetical protein C1Y35_07710 [Pseudomonas sp. GW456-L14]|nr:hypothetical protein C1Y35_07710 [Pseudomonas sp. GW456-L14]PMY54770.1 hypothetical protein C1Y34_17120 [Pseudomonas sp. GW456-L12]